MTVDGWQRTAEHPVAATAGQTADGRSTWAIGYMPQLVIGAWVGQSNAESSRTVGTVSGFGATAPLRALMDWAVQTLQPGGWEQPPGLIELEVCDPSGLLPTADCPIISELFIEGTQPTARDTVFQPVYVNRETGRLATVATPPYLVERRIYQVFPPAAAEWAREAGLAVPPTEYDTLITHTTIGKGIAAIEEPGPFAVISGEVVIKGTASGDGFTFYRLSYFPGLYPEEVWLIADEETEPKTNAVIGIWDTSGLEEGVYTLLLTAVNEDGTFAEASVPVSIVHQEN
jgi:membrane carboxypeptidase/penicillin-binding protein PbpC